jgi:dienelactone hydrolase
MCSYRLLFGGTAFLKQLGHLNVKGVVSFHGGLGKDKSRPNEPITAKVLVCHGADDFESAEVIAFSTRNAQVKPIGK